ncbi:unnamed protein product, partial [Amoebophrya sp. A25]
IENLYQANSWACFSLLGPYFYQQNALNSIRLHWETKKGRDESERDRVLTEMFQPYAVPARLATHRKWITEENDRIRNHRTLEE